MLRFLGHPVLLAFFHGGGGAGERPLRQFAPPEIWSENNRKISITKDICITIDFAPPPEKNPGRKPVLYVQLLRIMKASPMGLW